jgi:hypothetical protein
MSLNVCLTFSWFLLDPNAHITTVGDKKDKSAMTTCTICGQQIAVDELQEHMRIELLDPKWKEQRDNLEARKAQASELQRGANVVTSLQNLARTRVDIFGTETDEERRKREEAMEKEKRKEREKVVWDGHTASKANTLDKFSTNVNFDEQIAAIHRAKGLGPYVLFSFLFFDTVSVIDLTAKQARNQRYRSWNRPRSHSPTPCHTSSCPRFSTCSTSICEPRRVFGSYSLIRAATRFYVQHPIASDAAAFALSRHGRCSTLWLSACIQRCCAAHDAPDTNGCTSSR